MADFGDLLRQANQMQEQLLAAQAAAAGGTPTVTINQIGGTIFVIE